ncbi:MAG: neutral/alkaline non-lysosomal ceramidase N-terminal domain-containing protein [Lentisphaeria bacterium]|nr:neutral/alkaline non-lysosomal ceramidase N-terminal domain-containing protein [Lentisphaeria bacterium]
MSGNINIGWGRRSLNPGRSVAIPGQFHMRVSQGELNPVTANALVIENGSDAVIFVTVDMVSIRYSLLDIVVEKLRRTSPEIPGDKIIMSTTHTHAGPNAADKNYPCDVDWMGKEETLDFLAGRIAEAVAEAWHNRELGSVAYGYGFATVGHSRRVVYLDDISKRPEVAAKPGIAVDGHGKMYGNTNDPQFSHYEAGTDSFINIMYTFGPTGRLSGAIVNVPCPAQTNEHSWLLHAGFWHNVREKLRAKYGDIGIITQCAAGGDLSPRQLHYNRAELRRYQLKYPEKFAYLNTHPFPYPEGFFRNEAAHKNRNEKDLLDMLRAEDIAERIAAAFDEVLEWAGKERLAAPELCHKVKKVKLERRMFPEDIYRAENANYENLAKQPWRQTGDKWADLRDNSILSAARARCAKVKATYEGQNTDRQVEVTVHTVRIGGAAFASDPFELFIDYMHRIQARSPFVQTFIVQLAADKAGIASYLATERAIANKGYSASPYCNVVSAKGGQQLVEATLKMLDDML